MRLFPLTAAALAAASLSFGAAAVATSAEKTPTPAAAKPGTAVPSWIVDKAGSRIRFKSAFSGDAWEGGFGRWDAQIKFDPKNLAGSKVVVNVDVTSAASGDKDRDESMPTADWFNSPRFPKATFTTNAIRSLGSDRYQADGTLTLKGVSKPVTLPFTLTIQGDTARMNGQTVINRSQFGIGQGQFANAETVPFDVTVIVGVVAKRGS